MAKFNIKAFGGFGIGRAFGDDRENDGRHSKLSIALAGGTPWEQYNMEQENQKIAKDQRARDALDDAASNPNSAYISTVPATERDGNTDIPWQRFNYGRQG